jgi:hypothetical protein
MRIHKWGFIDIYFNEDERKEVDKLVKRWYKQGVIESPIDQSDGAGIGEYEYGYQLLRRSSVKEQPND